MTVAFPLQGQVEFGKEYYIDALLTKDAKDYKTCVHPSPSLILLSMYRVRLYKDKMCMSCLSMCLSLSNSLCRA